MTRIATTYYGADPTTQFQWATAGSDQFSRIYDLYYLAQAVEYHDHSNTRGLAVARVADGSLTAAAYAALSVGTAALANLSVTNGKLGDLSVSTGKIQDAAITDVKMANQKANRVGDTFSGNINVNNLVGLYGKTTGGVLHSLAIVDGSNVINYGSGSLPVQINATTFKYGVNDIWHAGVFAQPTATPTAGRVPIADGSGRLEAWVGTATPTASRVPIADGSGKLDAWISPAVGVPSGIIAAVPTAAQIPSGWSRYTNGDGRFLIGAGTTFSQTFVENNFIGASNWTPVTGLSTAASGDTSVGATAGGLNLDPLHHTHTINGQGSAWVPPSRSVVWVQKS